MDDRAPAVGVVLDTLEQPCAAELADDRARRRELEAQSLREFGDAERAGHRDCEQRRYVPRPHAHRFLWFAIGANQTPGPWTVIAKKRIGPATTMRVQITFY